MVPEKQDELLLKFYSKQNDDNIRYMLSKEAKCLISLRTKDKNIKKSNVSGVGDVIRNLDYLSENIVKFLNVPKITKKKFS